MSLRKEVKQDVSTLREEVRKQIIGVRSPMQYCTLCVRATGAVENVLIGKSKLQEWLCCDVIKYACIKTTPNPVFKVKISELDRQGALVLGCRAGCCSVSIWKNRQGGAESRSQGPENRVGMPLQSCRQGLNIT